MRVKTEHLIIGGALALVAYSLLKNDKVSGIGAYKKPASKYIIAEKGDFHIEHYGGSDYFVVDNTGTVWYRENTEKKARNRLEKVLSCYL